MDEGDGGEDGVEDGDVRGGTMNGVVPMDVDPPSFVESVPENCNIKQDLVISLGPKIRRPKSADIGHNTTIEPDTAEVPCTSFFFSYATRACHESKREGKSALAASVSFAQRRKSARGVQDPKGSPRYDSPTHEAPSKKGKKKRTPPPEDQGQGQQRKRPRKKLKPKVGGECKKVGEFSVPARSWIISVHTEHRVVATYRSSSSQPPRIERRL
ncbi:hypothetical protein OF83DRAFT_933119 [Amylostereum chailletii]|nr:hypothetical protein OF83DRAFT_933119 [Amylostereum chailletii]